MCSCLVQVGKPGSGFSSFVIKKVVCCGSNVDVNLLGHLCANRMWAKVVCCCGYERSQGCRLDLSAECETNFCALLNLTDVRWQLTGVYGVERVASGLFEYRHNLACSCCAWHDFHTSF